MTLLLAITIPGSPVPKARPRLGKGGHVFTPKRTRDAEARIGWYLKVRYPHLVPSTARLRVVARFHLKGVRGDADNFQKLLGDALNTRAYLDDKQIDEWAVSVIRYSDNPRTECEVWEI